MGREEIAVGVTAVTERSGERSTPQHHLPDHEFAIVFSGHASKGLKAGIGVICRASPFPDLPMGKQRRGCFPLKFGWQPRAGPRCISGRLIEAHMLDWRVGV